MRADAEGGGDLGVGLLRGQHGKNVRCGPPELLPVPVPQQDADRAVGGLRAFPVLFSELEAGQSGQVLATRLPPPSRVLPDVVPQLFANALDRRPPQGQVRLAGIHAEPLQVPDEVLGENDSRTPAASRAAPLAARPAQHDLEAVIGAAEFRYDPAVTERVPDPTGRTARFGSRTPRCLSSSAGTI